MATVNVERSDMFRLCPSNVVGKGTVFASLEQSRNARNLGRRKRQVMLVTKPSAVHTLPRLPMAGPAFPTRSSNLLIFSFVSAKRHDSSLEAAAAASSKEPLALEETGGATACVDWT